MDCDEQFLARDFQIENRQKKGGTLIGNRLFNLGHPSNLR